MANGFTWRDGERLIVFRQGEMREVPEILDRYRIEPYELLSTERALAGAPAEIRSGATAVHEVSPRPVPNAASELIGQVKTPRLVALGGGRVIDTAKAIAGVRGGAVVAVPTTLSGAEMTAIHRFPAGYEKEAAFVRPVLVIADPEAMTSAPEERLRASAMNALAHGAEALYAPLANPVAELLALRGTELIAGALDEERDQRDRPALALGALLCGYAIDSAGLSLHHVISQTLVRLAGTPHAETNAAVLPHVLDAARKRFPEKITALAAALGTSAETIAERVTELGRPATLGELGADRDRLEAVLDEATARLEAGTPDPPSRQRVQAIIEAAW